MNDSILPPPQPAFKDRSAGLMAFGILTILGGCLCALFVPLMLFSFKMAEQTSGVTQDFRTTLPSIGFYGFMAVTLIGLGIGSIRARRWARALVLILAWTWLGTGVLAAIALAFFFPAWIASLKLAQGGNQNLPASFPLMVAVITLLILGFVFIVLPGIWVLFYRSPHVKATCEQRDPQTRWTDGCPLPVLAISLWLALGAVMFLAMPLFYRGVFPFFGVYLTGVAGSLLYVALAGFWLWAARAFYRLQIRAWWCLAIFMVVLAVSYFLTYYRIDSMELYRLMGYPEAQIKRLSEMSALNGHNMAWGTLVFMAIYFGYLVYIKRFFPEKNGAA